MSVYKKDNYWNSLTQNEKCKQNNTYIHHNDNPHHWCGDVPANMADSPNTSKYWDRKSRLVWTTALFAGCLFVYCTRTTMSICAMAIGSELGWDKQISGFVMSAFFLGYILTQILGGIIADRYGGDRTMFKAACVWGSCTLLTPYIGKMFMLPQTYGIAFAQALAGIAQGVHFPSLASLVGKKISDEHRNSAFSFAASGTMLGSLLTGIVGSLLLEYFGWRIVFLSFGTVSLLWALMLYFLISMDATPGTHSTSKATNPSFPNEDEVPLVVKDDGNEKIQWRKVLTYNSFWALFVTTFCESFVFTNLISWLPTYFRELYPQSEPWVYNMLPWISTFISSNTSGLLSDQMVANGVSLTKIRKLFVCLALLSAGVLCLILSHVKTFGVALVLLMMVCFFLGCNSCGIGMNPQDLMPKHAGVLYGIMNTAAAISGMAGVSLVGHILHVSKDWYNVFVLISASSFFGGIIFLIFGSGNRIDC